MTSIVPSNFAQFSQLTHWVTKVDSVQIVRFICYENVITHETWRDYAYCSRKPNQIIEFCSIFHTIYMFTRVSVNRIKHVSLANGEVLEITTDIVRMNRNTGEDTYDCTKCSATTSTISQWYLPRNKAMVLDILTEYVRLARTPTPQHEGNSLPCGGTTP